MEKLLYRKSSTNHYFGVGSWPVAKEDSSIRTLSEEVSCWKDLDYIDKSSKMPKKKDFLYPIQLQEAKQEALRTIRKRRNKKEKGWKREKSVEEDAGFSVFSFQYWMRLKVTYSI